LGLVVFRLLYETAFNKKEDRRRKKEEKKRERERDTQQFRVSKKKKEKKREVFDARSFSFSFKRCNTYDVLRLIVPNNKER
jgi:hypothetical protein